LAQSSEEQNQESATPLLWFCVGMSVLVVVGKCLCVVVVGGGGETLHTDYLPGECYSIL